jgi:glycosyltransferase involved in cell wall biosynthesis
MISVLILTKNEEVNLPRCLESVRSWSDDILILDSGSTDRTVEIAKEAGCRVFQRDWDGESGQRAYSLTLPFKYPWIYNPDADEVCVPDMIAEMKAIAADPATTYAAYRVRFRVHFFGTWIRHSSLYPTWVVRLFRPEKIRFEREINLTYVVDGSVGSLESHFIHYSFNNGLAAWVEKHNIYSSKEAQESLRFLASGHLNWSAIFRGPTVARRKALKELSFRLPFRPTLRFFYMYVFRLGFLDGRAGYHYCRLLAMYEYLIVIKMKEIQRRVAGLPV